MVNVLVATEAQEIAADRDRPTSPAVDGELLYVPITAVGRCNDGFVGMASHRKSTRALVVRRTDLSVADLWSALSDSLVRQRALSHGAADRWGEEEAECFRHLFQRMLATGSYFSVGSILVRRGERIDRIGVVEPLSIPSHITGGER